MPISTNQSFKKTNTSEVANKFINLQIKSNQTEFTLATPFFLKNRHPSSLDGCDPLFNI